MAESNGVDKVTAAGSMALLRIQRSLTPDLPKRLPVDVTLFEKVKVVRFAVSSPIDAKTR